ncbi:hypothetical protein [Planctomycetes bacterium K23_9]|uniref:Uncharacterized protein n=1 Tax=Stieleria marina TaxID=1930275 RepID=A0A517NVE5_9BACT|nr:hypothetical protein K239x_30920 [Planctomycetes bacterium K23_9]
MGARVIWKVLTVLFAVSTLVLAARIYAVPRATDARLIGTWVSDKERTMEGLGPQVTDEQREVLNDVFGKLKITYNAHEYVYEMDGESSSVPYSVIGSDDYSLVIQDHSPPIPEMEMLNMSSFTKIYFEGPDVYYVDTELSSYTEYFKRLSGDR